MHLVIISTFICVIFISSCSEQVGKESVEQSLSTEKQQTVTYKNFLPKEIVDLPEDFYPAGLTREIILAKLPQAVKKTGCIGNDIWSGVILVTGDLEADNLIIEPGTIVFIEANKDDQRQGQDNNVDPMNPHEFLGKDYSREHINIYVKGKLTAKGTPENSIIITSIAKDPWLADWDHISFEKGILEYAVIEYVWGVSLRSSDSTISHCLIRNVLQQGVMFGTWPEAEINGEPVSPDITYNYMYNFGHMAVQSFFSEPYIANNIFIQKNTNDPQLYAYLCEGENGALGILGGGGIVENNFLSCGYTADLEKEEPRYGCSGIVITTGSANLRINYNTIVSNNEGIGLQGGLPVVNNNNIYNNVGNNLAIRSLYSETGRKDQTIIYGKILDFTNNWWGTSDENKTKDMIRIDRGVEVVLDPISESKIPNTGPDWNEFEWLWGTKQEIK